MLGICNGFQTLLKAGVLPSGIESWNEPRSETSATLTWNHNGRYTARWVHLSVGETNSVFLRGMQELDLPIAHAEGRLVARSASVVDGWKQQGQLALKYASWPQEPSNQRDLIRSVGRRIRMERSGTSPG
ncbi:MAG: phosphoribosylformylglycinamidine synthase subunit PurQ [Planctomycetaceae bacterium]